ncbi:hypothetical protein THAOC_22632 [Thalassiosira oceanica]|uniref:MORN repeat-containing protein 5 n=1 Tax=Thalassiosira oceanica TaxID=159749 RepID=K0RWH4_THAOC|nr:hypothetical protein THAOC_22632 [Thalassiosira oceanica]|eukprot:EJK57335.1 hypothetical protein THAOC_22632 [Thalassiosira oceanica]
MATNMKVNGGWMFTGQVVGGQLNGPGKITFADGGELRGNFVNGKLVEGTATDYKHTNGDNTYIFVGDNAYIYRHRSNFRYVDKPLSAEYTYTGRVHGGTKNGVGKQSFTEFLLHGIVYAGLEDGIYVDGQLKRGKVTYSDGHPLKGRKMLEGVFVDRWLHGPGTCTWCGRRVEKDTFDHVRSSSPSAICTRWN